MPLTYFECTQENTVVDESADFGKKELSKEEVEQPSVEMEPEPELNSSEKKEESDTEEMQDRKTGGAFMGTFEGNDGHNVV